MVEEVRKKLDRYLPFVLEGSDLFKLEGILQQFGPVTCWMRCEDGITRKLEVREILKYENPPDAQIRSIELAAGGPGLGGILAPARIEFAASHLENVQGHLQGPEADVFSVSGRLDAVLAGLKPWYAWLSMREALFFLFPYIVFFLVLNGLVALWVLGWIDASQLLSGARPVYAAWLMGLALAFGVILDKVRGYLFPRSVFAIGQGANRYRRRHFIRVGIIIAFLVNLLAGLVGAGILAVPALLSR